MSAVDDALRALSGDQPGVLTSGDNAGSSLSYDPAAQQQPQSNVDRALNVLDMSPEELKAATAKSATGGFNQRAGSFATGANDVLATTLGAPFDFSAWLGNQAVRGINALTGKPRTLSDLVLENAGGPSPAQTVAPVTRPWLGSENIRDWLSGAVGRTDPKDELDRVLYGAGAGVASAATGMGVGGALQAAGRAPILANALLGGPGLGGAASTLATGAGGGAGSVAGQDTIKALGGGETAQALGAMGGGLLGGFGTGLVSPLAVNTYRVGQAAGRPFTESGRQGIAGRILNESATYGEPDIQPGLLGTRPTLGQASNDPGLLSLERTVQQSSPAIQGEMARRASENNQQLLSVFDRLGSPAGREPYQISQEAATGLEANRATARAAEGEAWRAIDPTNSLMVPMQPIRERMQSYIDSLTMARRPLVPDDLVGMVMQSGGAEQLPMRELQDIRSAITGRERLARNAGDYNQANVYRNLDEALFQRLPEGAGPLPSTADQAATMRYQSALDASRQYNETFNRKPIRDIFRTEGTPDSAVLDKMLAPGQGQAERVGQYTAATMGDPTLMQHGRDWFTARLAGVVGSARQDAEGDPFVLGNKLSKFVTQNRPLIDSPLFTADQRNVIDSLVEAATTVERTARAGPVGGSDTAAKLAGRNYVSALVGNWFQPVMAAEALGAAAGTGILGGPGGAVAGGLAAGRAATPLVDRAYSGAAQRVMDLLSTAMLDPEFARELMRNASPGNTSFASPRLQNFLATAPLTIETTRR